MKYFKRNDKSMYPDNSLIEDDIKYDITYPLDVLGNYPALEVRQEKRIKNNTTSYRVVAKLMPRGMFDSLGIMMYSPWSETEVDYKALGNAAMDFMPLLCNCVLQIPDDIDRWIENNECCVAPILMAVTKKEHFKYCPVTIFNC